MGMTMAMASMGASALSGVMGAGSASSEGASAANQARYNAQVAEQNAQLAELRKIQIQEAANEAIQDSQVETSQIVSLQDAQVAGAGILVGQDTALDTTVDTIRAGTLDKIAIQRNADLDKWSAQIAANSSRDQSALLESSARSAKRAGRTNALSSLIGAAGTVASKWMTIQD